MEAGAGMVRKKVDGRIKALVENCAAGNTRGLVVVVGDKGRDQVVNLHQLLSRAAVKARPAVLWCYKKALHLSSHRKKHWALAAAGRRRRSVRGGRRPEV